MPEYSKPVAGQRSVQAPEAGHESRVVDEKTISLLSGDPAILHKVLNMFLKSMTKLIAEMESGIEQADTKQIMHASHTLKSSGAMIGAMDLSKLCKDIETITRKGELAGVECMVRQARKAGQLVEDDIRTVYLQNEASPTA